MKDINALRKEYDLNNLKGKRFRYKSQYGGIAEGIIEEVIETTVLKGTGGFQLVKTPKNVFPLHDNYTSEKQSNAIKSTNGIIYNLEEIEIL